MVKPPEFTQSSEAWLSHVKTLRRVDDVALFTKALHWSHGAPALTVRAIMMAELLLAMNLESETITATLLYPLFKANQAHLESIIDHFGVGVSRLLQDTLQLQSLSQCQQTIGTAPHQIENIRKMLIGMVTDIRAVLIVLAERLVLLREVKSSEREVQESLASETLAIYAPLANRLGAFEIKWELEDLCLRILNPSVYARITKALAERRSEREATLNRFITNLSLLLRQHHIAKADITGRVKHVYSIYQKMMRKNMEMSDMFDANALRILVEDIHACYAVLSILQNTFKTLPDEFEDYIAEPKANGYRSIHMVIEDQGHFVEIQIRTHAMHQDAELGSASHWRYKEGVIGMAPDEQKIALLRQIIAWQKEVSHDGENPLAQDIFADRVYVFTPQGDIIDLPKGATPIDFAYAIHSEVGHRCRGAKVDQKMVPITTVLQTGNRVEIITAKTAGPSRDWMNPQLGYVVTSRARSVISHWFRTQDALKERDLPEKAPAKTHKLPEKPRPDIYTAIKNKAAQMAKQLTGIDSLLTKVGRCCQPLPGDKVMGYITQNRGISIHRLDCSNLKRLSDRHSERLLEVNWASSDKQAYAVDVWVLAESRPELLRDLTGVLATSHIQLIGLTTHALEDGEVEVKLVLLIAGIAELNQAIRVIKQLDAVKSVKRY